MIPIQSQDGRVLIDTPNELVVFTKAAFIQALRRGKGGRLHDGLTQRQLRHVPRTG
jgi:hypothetical protein